MTTMRLEIGSATADQAREFIIAFQRTRAIGLPSEHEVDLSVRIAGIGWHVGTPNMSPERAAEMMAILKAGERAGGVGRLPSTGTLSDYLTPDGEYDVDAHVTRRGGVS